MSNMAMNKVWAASDYKALMKRLAFASGMIANKKPETEELAAAQRDLAIWCERYLAFYNENNK